MTNEVEHCRSFAFYFIRYEQTSRYKESRHGLEYNLFDAVSAFLYYSRDYGPQGCLLRKGSYDRHQLFPDKLLAIPPVAFGFQLCNFLRALRIKLKRIVREMVHQQTPAVVPADPLL